MGPIVLQLEKETNQTLFLVKQRLNENIGETQAMDLWSCMFGAT